VAEQPTEKNLPWLVLRAANQTQAKGSTVRLIVPRAPEVAEELGMELTDERLLAVQEHLQQHGYVEPANIGLTWGAYTITQAGLRWLEEAQSELSESPTVATESDAAKPERVEARESPEMSLQEAGGGPHQRTPSERPWWRFWG
jgi:hypothetical protein